MFPVSLGSLLSKRNPSSVDFYSLGKKCSQLKVATPEGLSQSPAPAWQTSQMAWNSCWPGFHQHGSVYTRLKLVLPCLPEPSPYLGWKRENDSQWGFRNLRKIPQGPQALATWTRSLCSHIFWPLTPGPCAEIPHFKRLLGSFTIHSLFINFNLCSSFFHWKSLSIIQRTKEKSELSSFISFHHLLI